MKKSVSGFTCLLKTHTNYLILLFLVWKNEDVIMMVIYAAGLSFDGLSNISTFK